ncbi:TlpA family protein disulfide reductase [Segetibacter sp. 3557_3]|uniref:TlpA family protein disulfide reductase n=1 Tax=Segetibacter sp. 3557_3 TaxID=2547429 RepID=UPI0010587DC7|nr:TlpA disulfide reductase family protein [Segetibacter sp. 3557_3]TDH26919.1 TlpA family protein disulfide reductase [Segetibacter sp. 3557_3]
MKSIVLVLLTFFYLKLSGQSKIYFQNKTGRPIMIQKRTILEVGSYPYTLDTNAHEFQNIPMEDVGPMILGVVVVPPQGPYGSPDGVYFLFKPNDTLLINLNRQNKPLITHISSSTRTNELSFAQKHHDFVATTPLYALYGQSNNAQLFKQLWRSAVLKRRDYILDSLYWPYINTAETFCVNNSIDPMIGRLFKSFYLGSMISDKLFGGRKIDPTLQSQLVKFYQDSLITWSGMMNCIECGNIPSFNLGLKEVFRLRFRNLKVYPFIDTISFLTRGYARDFLLSSFVVDKMEGLKQPDKLLAYYYSLCKDPIYNQKVKNNYMLRKGDVSLKGSDIAVLMKANKSQIGFNQLVSSLKGKVVYVDFWASWCKPCIEEMRFSHALKERLAKQNIVMLYISVDTDFSSWVQAREKYKVNGEYSVILVNPEKSGLTKMINLGPIPRYVILNKMGKIVRFDATRPSDETTYNTLMQMSNE